MMAQFRLDNGEGGEVEGTTISDGLGDGLEETRMGGWKTALATQYNTVDSRYRRQSLNLTPWAHPIPGG
jgi:hypothetical protein